MRGGEIEDDALIENAAIAGAEPAKSGMAGLGKIAADRLSDGGA